MMGVLRYAMGLTPCERRELSANRFFTHQFEAHHRLDRPAGISTSGISTSGIGSG
jgi:hypothetical protein